MLWLLAATALAAEPDTPEPKDFIAMMEKSPRHYKISSEEHPVAQWAQQNAMRTWPPLRESLGTIERVKRPDGTYALAPCGHDPEVTKLLDVSEPLFEAKKYKQAEA